MTEEGRTPSDAAFSESALHDLEQLLRIVRGGIETMLTTSNGTFHDAVAHWVVIGRWYPGFASWCDQALTMHSLPYDQLARAFQVAYAEIVRASLLMENVILSLDASDTVPAKPVDVDIGALLTELQLVYEGAASLKGIAIELRCDEALLVAGDQPSLFRMFGNLLDNAIKYSFAPTETSGRRFVRVDALRHSAAGEASVRVSSYGVGILEDEIRERSIFKLGVRGKLAQDRSRRGTGIGLYSADRVARRHGGYILVDSHKANDGEAFITTVIVRLPREGMKRHVKFEDSVG